MHNEGYSLTLFQYYNTHYIYIQNASRTPRWINWKTLQNILSSFLRLLYSTWYFISVIPLLPWYDGYIIANIKRIHATLVSTFVIPASNFNEWVINNEHSNGFRTHGQILIYYWYREILEISHTFQKMLHKNIPPFPNIIKWETPKRAMSVLSKKVQYWYEDDAHFSVFLEDTYWPR